MTVFKPDRHGKQTLIATGERWKKSLEDSRLSQPQYSPAGQDWAGKIQVDVCFSPDLTDKRNLYEITSPDCVITSTRDVYSNA